MPASTDGRDRIAITMAVAVLALSATTDRLRADGPESDKPAAVKPFEYVSPEIERLSLFVGPWRVTERHFNTKGDVIATVKGTEEITWLLDRRAIQRAYSTVSDTAAFKALGTLTYNAALKRYEGVWFDNMSTSGAVNVKADWDPAARTMTYTLEARGVGGAVKTYKRIEEFPNEERPDDERPERRTATTFEVVGEKVIRLLEVQYTRATPCPSKIQRVFDG